LERNKYYELSRAQRAKEYHDVKNAAIQERLNDIAAYPNKTASLLQAFNLANAQDRTWHRRWSLTTESKPARHLSLSIAINKRRIVDSYFQAVRGKLGTSNQDAGQKPVVLLYSDGKFPTARRRGRRRSDRQLKANGKEAFLCAGSM
jgi:hypothetical protein